MGTFTIDLSFVNAAVENGQRIQREAQQAIDRVNCAAAAARKFSLDPKVMKSISDAADVAIETSMSARVTIESTCKAVENAANAKAIQ